MEQLDLNIIYDLGEKLGKIDSLTHERPIADQLVHVSVAKWTLNNTLNSQHNHLEFARTEARQLLQNLHDFESIYTLDSEGKFRWPDPNVYATSFELNNIKDSYQRFKNVFSAEMRNMPTFRARQQGIYSTQLLATKAHKALDERTLKRISDKAREELRAAGRCLSFELGSAAAFHASRALEECLRPYYEFFTSKKVSKQSWNLGARISSLEKVMEDPKSERKQKTER